MITSFCADYARHGGCGGGSAGRIPQQLTPRALDEIRAQIQRNNLPELPELAVGERFYTCTYCGAVWRALSARQEWSPGEEGYEAVLGWYDSANRWNPKSGERRPTI